MNFEKEKMRCSSHVDRKFMETDAKWYKTGGCEIRVQNTSENHQVTGSFFNPKCVIIVTDYRYVSWTS